MSARAEIYDLGYKRYAGPRRDQSSRWRVIMRHQMATTWKGFWRYKSILVLTTIVTGISAITMWMFQDKAVGIFGDSSQRLADTVVPLATTTYCKFAFLMSLTVCASAISTDHASGAFTFYFARSTRPIDYVLGKFAGLYVMVAPIMLLSPLILAGVQLALTPENRSIADELIVVPKTLFIGLLGTAIYAAVPLAFSALSKGRMMAIGGWAIYYVVFGGVANGFGMVVYGPLAALDLAGSLNQTAIHIFGLTLEHSPINVPLWASLPGVIVPVIAGLGVALWKIKNAADTGVGGAS